MFLKNCKENPKIKTRVIIFLLKKKSNNFLFLKINKTIIDDTTIGKKSSLQKTLKLKAKIIEHNHLVFL